MPETPCPALRPTLQLEGHPLPDEPLLDSTALGYWSERVEHDFAGYLNRLADYCDAGRHDDDAALDAARIALLQQTLELADSLQALLLSQGLPAAAALAELRQARHQNRQDQLPARLTELLRLSRQGPD